MWLYLVLFVVLYFIYKCAVEPIFYWRKRGIPHHTPWPIFGNFYSVMMQKQSFLGFQEDIYKAFDKHRYNGFFQLTSPTLYIRDLDLVKDVLVKHFDHFTDHRSVGSEYDVLYYKNLFSLKGNEWREMRAYLSPAFAPSKIKAMFDLMSQCAQRLTEFHLEKSLESPQIEVELGDIFKKYANDVIGTCAFGVECDSLRNPENEFYRNGMDATNFTGFSGVKIMLAHFAPDLFKFFNMKVLPQNVSDFFINLIKESLAYREKNNVIRPDVIQLLMDARKGKLKHEKQETQVLDDGYSVIEESAIGKVDVRLEATLSDEDIASQCFIFFFAGLDTIPALLNCAITELAIDPDIQSRLFVEIHTLMQETNGKPTYEKVMEMKYLDMILSETLRKWPAASAIDRVCTKDCTIDPIHPNEVPVTIKAGDRIGIPTGGIQRDPRYFPHPEKFDPERFAPENVKKILPYTYLPFGLGPRGCIGTRFALLETKIVMIHLLSKFEAVVIEKTSVPLTLSTKSMKFAPDNGFWVGLRRRQACP